MNTGVTVVWRLCDPPPNGVDVSCPRRTPPPPEAVSCYLPCRTGGRRDAGKAASRRVLGFDLPLGHEVPGLLGGALPAQGAGPRAAGEGRFPGRRRRAAPAAVAFALSAGGRTLGLGARPNTVSVVIFIGS